MKSDPAWIPEVGELILTRGWNMWDCSSESVGDGNVIHRLNVGTPALVLEVRIVGSSGELRILSQDGHVGWVTFYPHTDNWRCRIK